MKVFIKYETSNKKLEVSAESTSNGLLEAIGHLTIFISIVVCCCFIMSLILTKSKGGEIKDNEHIQPRNECKCISSSNI